jgi:hypothetical protein
MHPDLEALARELEAILFRGYFTDGMDPSMKFRRMENERKLLVQKLTAYEAKARAPATYQNGNGHGNGTQRPASPPPVQRPHNGAAVKN